MLPRRHLAGAVALAAMNTPSALAASAPHCVGSSSNVCFSWGVPEAAIQSGSGNVYFQLRAPQTYEWAGLGIGRGMRGAEIFLMYQDGSGNVTLSTRSGVGHVMPQYTQRSNVELLAGSGVVDNQMVANVRCGDCGSLDLKGSSSWISAWKVGQPINSKDKNAQIDFHDGTSVFDVDLSQASVSSDSNPFVEGGGSSSNGNNNGDGSGTGNGSGSGSSGNTGGIVSDVSSGSAVSNAILYGHGIIMMLVWVILYPVGAVLMPLLGKWVFHAGFQMIAFLAMWAGLGLGYVMANRLGIFWRTKHTCLGIMVCALMSLQPFLGYLHHMSFKRQGRRGILSHVHVWYGRILILLGIINGGLGLQLAQTQTRAGNSLKIAYIVLSAVVAGVYFLSIPWIELRKARVSRHHSKAHKAGGSSDENSAR